MGVKETVVMKILAWSFCLLALAKVSMAEDYLLDASTKAVGATAGENLVVKEGCFDPTNTDCTEKLNWFHAPLGKIGSLEIIGTLQGYFEVSITGDFDAATKSVVLTDNENKGIQYSQTKLDDGYLYGGRVSLYPTGTGEGGGESDGRVIDVWNKDYNFNAITITVQNGLARARINGTQIGKEVAFEPVTAFTRVVIQGITSDDRLTEVKVRGLQTAIKLINISTRALIQGGADNVIAGFIITGTGTQKVVVTARGKSVNMSQNLLCQDTTMSVYKIVSGNGVEIANNDDWQEDAQATNIPTHLQPSELSDAALLLNLETGAYTVIMGCIGGAGIGLIGVNIVEH
jgi:hypothetical protein